MIIIIIIIISLFVMSSLSPVPGYRTAQLGLVASQG